MERRKIKMSIKGISKSFLVDKKSKESVKVLEDVNIDVYENEFLVLLGPGRCGKTVLMNIMAGLMEADAGSVMLDGEEVTGPTSSIGVVFQKTGLLPWKTVMQNAELGPKMRNVPKDERREKCKYFLELVGLKGFENFYPRKLSGGMKQRVGIARAYSNDTDVLLMDEPFGALDAQTRYSMQNEVLRMWEQEKRTVVFVTNNLEEALFLGDRIILLTQPPCHVKEIYVPDIAKPRDNMDIKFLQLRKQIEDNTELVL